MESSSSKISLAMFALAAMAMAVQVAAQNTPQDFVNLHNRARAVFGVGPVVWDNTVAKYARNYAAVRSAECLLKHSDRSPYGENIFWGSGQSWTAADAVRLWVDEKRNYHLNSNSCDAGKMCGHYKQVVWRKSTRIGCARVICAGNRGVFIICSYNPRGNMNGERPF